METERPAESTECSRAASTTRDVAIRESAAPIPRSINHSRHPSQPAPAAAADRMPSDVWTSAISRLQAQVSYNTGMLESHRRQLSDIEAAITRLHQEMNHVVATFNDVRAEIRSQPAAPERPKSDPADLEVLAGQLQRLTNRVNEIDGLTMQMDLMKNRMKRLDGGSAATPLPLSAPHVHAERPAASSAYRDAAMYDAVPPPPQPHQPQTHPVPPPPPHHHAAQHPPLPPMRTASIPSSDLARPPSFPSVAEAQVTHRYRPSSESRPFSSDAPTSQPPASSASAFRPGEALPPPSALSGWRPAEAFPPGASPRNVPLVAPGFRPQTIDSDPHGAPTSGWAAVNTNPAIKRPPEETRSPYESPQMDGSKRPKLAPLMPNVQRVNHGEETSVPSQPGYLPGVVTTNPSEASGHPRSRAPSDGSQPPSHPMHTPAQQALQHNFRFITSTQQVEPQESCRPEGERPPPPPEHGPGSGPRGGRGGRGRGRGGRGRGGRGRGGGAHGHHGHHGHHGNGGPPAHPGEAQEQSTPEWEKPEWSGGSHASPNGHYHPEVARAGGVVRRADAQVGFAGGERTADFPATPIQQPSGPYDPYCQANIDSSQMSSGKKTRTKPIRNAEGILIRKDGRPDMRSVSSANNLRKVHAKKEAERTGMDDDDDGTRSGTPTSTAAVEHEASEEPTDAQERHRDLMGRMFPQGMESAGRVAEQFFPRHEEASTMKTEESERDSQEESRSRSSQPDDVVMKETSEAQAEERTAAAAAAADQDTTNINTKQAEASSQEQAGSEERGSKIEDS